MKFEKYINSLELPNIVSKVSERVNNIRKNSRKLKESEIETLKSNNNFAENWNLIEVNGEIEFNCIRNNTFIGNVIISSNKTGVNFSETSLRPGIYNSTIENCIIDEGVLINRVGLLKNYYIGKNSLLLNNGSIISNEFPVYGNGTEIPVGIETGGRDIILYTEITLEEAEKLALQRGDKELLDSYKNFVERYIKAIKFKNGIIYENVKIMNTSLIQDTFVGLGCEINSATSIKNSSILSNLEERTKIKEGVYISDSIIQWGCEVSSMAIVSSSALTEHSDAERHGKVTNSIIGPNTGIGEGEVTASLVGPFVGFHHQSLLIGAIWPEGKGNIGYGANVGSNHTGKAPDQEIFCGEGTFFGLGTNIKFPANFVKAPYTIIATGVTTLPQKVEFPFSLIITPSETLEGISPAYNEIIPAWVLSDNIFAVKRNEGKYQKRNKAKRSKFVFEVFRPEIVDLMIEARERLKNVKEIKNVYTDSDIKGLGKNFMYEKSRLKAIETYTFFIKYYALKGLMKRISELLKNGVKKVNWNLLEPLSSDSRWQHEKKVLLAEFPEKKSLKELLELLIEYESKIAESVKISKEKDDKRGAKIIDDYNQVHTLADKDSFVVQTLKELEKTKNEIKEIIDKVS
jgi:NDP-sugar pyrophosphorylase family protein